MLNELLEKYNYIEFDMNSIQLKDKELFISETPSSKKSNSYIKQYFLKRKEHHCLYMVRILLCNTINNKWYILDTKEIKLSSAFTLHNRVYAHIERKTRKERV